MPYGQAGRMGDSVNPALFNPDFSGYERAGAAAGQALQNVGANIGESIKIHGENKKKVKKTEDLIKAVMNNFEGTAIGDQAANMFQQFSSDDISQRDQIAMGESIAEVLNIGLAGMEQKRADEMMALRRASLAARGGSGKPAPNPASIRASIDLMRAQGYGAAADSLQNSLNSAQTPEDMMGVANLIHQMSSSMGFSKFAAPEGGEANLPKFGTAFTEKTGDKSRTLYPMTFGGATINVDAKTHDRISKAIRKGEFTPGMLDDGEGLLDKIGGAIGSVFGRGPELGLGETVDKPRKTSIEQRNEALAEADRLEAAGDVQGAARLRQAVRLDPIDAIIGKAMSGDGGEESASLKDRWNKY